MRHQKNRHKMGRSKGHRKRTLQAMSCALIDKKRIQTTVSKAKALRPFVEPLITRAKEDTTHNRRQAFRHLQDKAAVRELFDEVAVEVGDRPGGYTRIIKLGRRTGDGAERAMMELVDYNDVQPKTGPDRSRTRRGSGGGAGSRSRETAQGPQPGRSAPEQTGTGEDPSEQSQGKPETSATETTDQQESLGGEEKAAVEAPVPEEQKESVPERTEAKDEAATDEVADTGDEAEEPGDESDEDEQKS